MLVACQFMLFFEFYLVEIATTSPAIDLKPWIVVLFFLFI